MRTNSNVQKMVSLSNISSFYLTESSRNKIKMLIKKNGLSQRKLAENSDGELSYPFIGKLLSGQQSGISKEKFMKLCDVLNADIEEILDASVSYFHSPA